MRKILFTLLIGGFCALNAADSTDIEPGAEGVKKPLVSDDLKREGEGVLAPATKLVLVGDRSFVIVDGVAYPVAAAVPGAAEVIMDNPEQKDEDGGKKLSLDRVVQREAKRVEQQVRQEANKTVQNAAKAISKWRF
jgi:hypothetical protein